MVVWFTFLTGVLTAKEANMQKYTKYAVFDVHRYINFSDFSSFIFKAPIEKVASCRWGRTSWYWNRWHFKLR